MIFKSIFSRKKDNKPEEIDFELKLDEVREWIENENRPFVKELEEDIKRNYENLEEKLLGLKESFSAFKRSTVDPEVMEKLKKAAKTNKITIENDMDSFLNSLSIPNEENFFTAYDFCLNASKDIKELGKRNRKRFIIVGEALREDTKNMTKSIGRFETGLLEMWEKLKEKEDRVRGAKEILTLVKGIRSDIKRGPEIEEEIKKMESAVGFQEQKERKAKKELDETRNSRAMKNLEKIREKSTELRKKRKELEERIHQEMSNFEKSFKKISHEKGLELMPYVENPVESLTQEDGLSKLKKSSETIKDAMEDLKLTGKSREKLETGLERLNSGVIEWIVKEHSNVSNEIEKMEKKLEEPKIVLEEREKKENYENWRQAMETTKKKIEDLKKEKKGLSSKISSKRKKLENKLAEVSGKKPKVIAE